MERPDVATLTLQLQNEILSKNLVSKMLLTEPIGPLGVAVYGPFENKVFVYTGDKAKIIEPAENVHVPFFEICASITVNITKHDEKHKMDVAISNLAAEILEKEMKCFLEVVKVAACNSKRVANISDACTKKDILDIKIRIDEYDLITDKFLMGASEFAKVASHKIDSFDPFGSREVIQTGVFANLWGSTVCVSKHVQPGIIYSFAEPEFVGVRPERQQAEIVNIKKIDDDTYQLTAREVIGIGIFDTCAIMVGKTESSEQWNVAQEKKERRQEMFTNTNDLVMLVRFRLASTPKIADASLEVFETTDIEMALRLALSAFNCVPYFTTITFDDAAIITHITDLLVSYACYVLLMKQSMVEKNREFVIQDGGIGFESPHLSDLLISISRDLLSYWTDQVKDLKEDKRFHTMIKESSIS